MPIATPCVERVGTRLCGVLSDQSRCPQHRKQHELGRRGVRSGWEWTRIKDRIKRRDGYRCVALKDGQRCGSSVDLEVDHALPRELGGTNDDDNLQTLCGECHAAKTRGGAKNL